MKRLVLLLCAVTTLSGCLILDGSFTEKEITAFSFQKETNAGLRKTYVGLIDDDSRTILVNVPDYMDVTRLIATFDYQGVAVTVNGILQESGVSMQDFSKPLTYSVKGKDDEWENYTVSVTVVPPSSETSIMVQGIGLEYNHSYARVNESNATIEFYESYWWSTPSNLYF